MVVVQDLKLRPSGYKSPGGRGPRWETRDLKYFPVRNGRMERLGVGYGRQFVGRDPWGQGVHAAHAGAEYGVPHRQYVLSRGADHGQFLRFIKPGRLSET